MFAKATRLNKEFTTHVGTDDAKQKSRRKELESYEENVIDKHLNGCVKLLSSGNDRDVARAFFEFLVSNENSADEQPLWAVGKVFWKNPGLVESTFAVFGPAERAVLYRSIEAGWSNVRDGIHDNRDAVDDRDHRLNELGSQVN
jgi:hypothetical protein